MTPTFPYNRSTLFGVRSALRRIKMGPKSVLSAIFEEKTALWIKRVGITVSIGN